MASRRDEMGAGTSGGSPSLHQYCSGCTPVVEGENVIELYPS